MWTEREMEMNRTINELVSEAFVMRKALHDAINVVDILANVPTSDWKPKAELQKIFKELNANLHKAHSVGKATT